MVCEQKKGNAPEVHETTGSPASLRDQASTMQPELYFTSLLKVGFRFLTFNTKRILNNTVRSFTEEKAFCHLLCLFNSTCQLSFYSNVLCKAKSTDIHVKISYLQDPPQRRIKHFPWKTKLASLRKELQGPKQCHVPIAAGEDRVCQISLRPAQLH